MCLSCGCNEPDEDHGDKRNITTKSLEDATQAGEVGSTTEVVQNIQNGFDSAGGGDNRNEMAGAATGSKNKQSTGNNEQSFKERQSGYSGGSRGPQ